MNGKGVVFYGIHMYPGVAEYEELGIRVFINEKTIRKMGPTFAGRPIFVEHVDEVEENSNLLRSEADGWVVESFYNAADGKNWVKFIVVSDEGLAAIRKGFRLSNAYHPKSFTEGGLWNGVSYEKEVTDGEFEHLAIVKNPRYEESVIMTPEEFKMHNEENTLELKRLANSKGDTKMKLNIFKRQKIENSVDFDGMEVELPKSKQTITLTKLVNEYDVILNMNGYANGDHMVKVGEKDEMSVNDLVKKHMEMCNEMEKMKLAKNDSDEDGGEPGSDEDDSMDNDVESVDEDLKTVGDRGGDVNLNNEEDEDEEKEKKEEKVKNAKAKALALKNAHLRDREEEEEVRWSLPEDQVARGKALYGSN
jgi:hypothetical protein